MRGATERQWQVANPLANAERAQHGQAEWPGLGAIGSVVDQAHVRREFRRDYNRLSLTPTEKRLNQGRWAAPCTRAALRAAGFER